MSSDRRLVSNEETNPSEDIYKKIELVNRLYTNYSKLFEYNSREELVSFVATNIVNGVEGRILQYIEKYPVFLVPTLIDNLKVGKGWVYKVIQKLKLYGGVVRTEFKIEPSSRRYAGPRPKIHVLAHINLSGRSDPRLRDARDRYWKYLNGALYEATQTNLDEDVGQSLIEYFHSKNRYAQFTPSHMEIIDYLRTSPLGKNIAPLNRKDYAKTVFDKLRIMKFGDEL